jgi:hypothetical protein
VTHAGLQSRFITNNSHHYPNSVHNSDDPNVSGAPSTVNQSSTPAPSAMSGRLTSEIGEISSPFVVRLHSTPSSQKSGNKAKTPPIAASTPPVSLQTKTAMSIDDKSAPRPDPNSASNSGLEAHSRSEENTVKPLIRHVSETKVQKNEQILSPKYQERIQETFNRPIYSYAQVAKGRSAVAPSPSRPNAHRSSHSTPISQNLGPNGYVPNSGQVVGSSNSTSSGPVPPSPFLISQPSVSSGRVPPKLGALGNELMYGSIDGDGDVSLPLFLFAPIIMLIAFL